MIQISIKNKIQFILFISLLTAGLPALSQSNNRSEKQFEKATNYFNANNLKMAAELAEKILEKDPDFYKAYLLLAEVAHDKGSAIDEIKYLEQAMKYTENPIIYVRLAEAKYSQADYADALEYFEKYLLIKNIRPERKKEIEQKIASCKFAIIAIKNPVNFQPERLSSNVNSENDEYWPVISIDQKELVFTRLIKATGKLPQEDFYISHFDSVGWSKAQPISEINTNRNEGAETLSADGKLMFFTACNRNDGYGSCDIYYSKWVNGKWSAPKNAGNPISTRSWEGQPSFSSDNQYLYFSSNRPGGKGQKDIWRAKFLGFNSLNGLSWGRVENLDSINTAGNEISPFIHANNKDLFFASDDYPGMGGMDLFRSKLQGRSQFSKPKNLGYPINTIKDEQGINITGDGTIAFFASDRGKNTGLDLYQFQLDKKVRPDPVTYVKARVIDAKTKQPVLALVELDNLTQENSEPRKELADAKGEILLCLPVGNNYSFTVSQHNYLFYSQTFQLDDINTLYKPFLLTIALQPAEVGAEMNLYNVYYEIDSFKILPMSEPELQKLLSFLRNNPDIKVEIQGHTDNTGNADKNLVLSEKRAKSVVDFLVENGIDKNRLQAKGFGAKQPVANNDTEEGRKLNRRTTVKITGNLE